MDAKHRMTIKAKICGLKGRDAVDAAVAAGADMTGFVFFPPSPRSLLPEAASELVRRVPPSIERVALTVDAGDPWLEAVARQTGVSMLQFHGTEPPERVAEIKARFGLPLIKACPISSLDDVDAARAYDGVADLLMFDAKPPKDATRPGGNALVFDWELLAGTVWDTPWILAGGLEADNVAEAVRISGAAAVDVSSGVEDAPGFKSPIKIREFLGVVKGL